MSDPKRQFVKGDGLGRLRDHSTLNAFLAGANLALGLDGQRTGGGASPNAASPANTVWLKAHADLSIGSVVGFGALADADVAEDELTDNPAKLPALLSADPAAGEPFAIVTNAAEEDEGFAAVVSGVALVRLSTPGGTVYDFAEAITDDVTMLLSAGSGPARVLWHEPDPEDEDERWALVLLGAAAGGDTGIARVTDPVEDGLYPAVLTEEIGASVWEDGSEVLVRGLYSEALNGDVRYFVRRAKWESDGVPVYHAIAVCCAPEEGNCENPCTLPDQMCVHVTHPSGLDTKILIDIGTPVPDYFSAEFPWKFGGFATSGTDTWVGYCPLGFGYKLYAAVARLKSDHCVIQAIGWVESPGGVPYEDPFDETLDLGYMQGTYQWMSGVNDGCSLPLDTSGPFGGYPPETTEIIIYGPWPLFIEGLDPMTSGLTGVRYQISSDLTGCDCTSGSGSGAACEPGTYPDDLDGVDELCLTAGAAVVTLYNCAGGLLFGSESGGSCVGSPWQLSFGVSGGEEPALTFDSGGGTFAVYTLDGDMDADGTSDWCLFYGEGIEWPATASIATGGCP